MVNLIKNSVESLLENPAGSKQIYLSIQEKNHSHFIIKIRDTGTGISPENLKNIFSHGFTTKKTGHGFGLHMSALSAKEMGGYLSVDSDGIGKGSTFTLVLPYKPVLNDTGV